MSRIDELIKQKCPEGVEYKKLEDVFVQFAGMTGVTNKWAENGNCRFVEYMNAYKNISIDVSRLPYATVKKLEQNILKKNDILFTSASEVPDECALASVIEDDIEDGIFLDDHLFGLRVKEQCRKYIYPSYLKYAFRVPEFRIQVFKVVRGVTRFYISKPDFMTLEIPVPPIKVQQEIVRILDKFTDLEAELQAELDARKKQYVHYREALLSFNDDIEIVTLDKCAEIGTGSSNTVDGIDDGEYPFFVRSQKPLTMNKFEYNETATITAGDGVGVGKVFHFIDGKYALHQRAYRIHITDKRINPKFFHYYFVDRFPRFIYGKLYEGSVPSIRRPMLNKFEVPIPSMEEQNRIVSILDKFEEYCNSEKIGLPAEIEARHKQYEYYRDKLLTFKRKVV